MPRTLMAAFQSQAALHLEILALRQQLAVLRHTGPRRPRLRPADRLFWVCLTKVWSGWRNALTVVTPDTVVGWSRRGLRLLWTWKSRRGKTGRPAAAKQIRHLIRAMSVANPLWGVPPHPGRVAETRHRGAGGHRGHVHGPAPPATVADLARLFLANHVPNLVSVDFFMVATVTFRIFFVFVVLAHHRRRVLHVTVTEPPTAAWTVQQIIEAFPWDSAPAYLLRDRDRIYGDHFRRRVTAMRIREVLIARWSAWQSPYVERLIASIRRDCLDHVIVLHARHVRRLLSSYLRYYHAVRTHLALQKDAPDRRPVQPRAARRVVALPQVGGLHHHYVRLAA